MRETLQSGTERRADEGISGGALHENGHDSAAEGAPAERSGIARIGAGQKPLPRSEAAIPQGVAAEVLLRDARYRRSLATADLVAAALAVFVGVTVIGDDALRPTILLALPVVVLVSKTMGLYDRDEHLLRKTTLDEAPALFQVATLYALVIWLGEQELFVFGDLGRDQVLGLWALLFLGMLTVRSVGRYLVRARSEPERCLVIGDEQLAGRVRRKLDSSMSANAVAVGRVPLPSDRRRHVDGVPPRGRERRSVSGLPNLGTIDSLGLVLVDHEIDRAIIAPPVVTSEHMLDVTDEMLDVVRMVRSLGVKVSVLPRLFEVVGSSVELDDVEGMILLGLRPDGLSKSSRFLKRAMDVTGAGAGLVLLAPVMAAVAVAVRVSSPGPILFRQKRIGRGGAEFSILKFRTMVDNAEDRKGELRRLNEADGLFKIADDPRLTSVGRLLRRTSLDELPQLINVLRGEMSLVGPRPLVPEEDRRIEGWARRRLHSPPGMTGVWQVFGSSRVPLHEMVKIDYLYCANWSLWLDVKILLRTVPHALGRRGL